MQAHHASNGMKNIKLFKTKKEYETFVFNDLFKETLITENPFYGNLIQFVIDSRAPIVYEQTDESEYSNFSPYYNFLLRRESYPNETLKSMYFLHEFIHMLFYYPHDIASVDATEFFDELILAEYAASNETEILIHFRIPELRVKIFNGKRIFFDILKERGVQKPTASILNKLRKLIIETPLLDGILFPGEENKEVLAFFKQYADKNKAFCKELYSDLLKINNLSEYFYKFLTPRNYERVLQNYRRSGSEEGYRWVVLMNTRLAYTILGLSNPPQTFKECLERIGELEGKVMFEK